MLPITFEISGVALGPGLATAALVHGSLSAGPHSCADTAAARHADNLATARDVRSAGAALFGTPKDSAMSAARAASIDARMPFQQTEVDRFDNPTLDDWQSKLNACPTDKGLIDRGHEPKGATTQTSTFAALNVIGNVQGEALVMVAVSGLIGQTRTIDRIVASLALDTVAFEGAHNLANPTAVFQ